MFCELPFEVSFSTVVENADELMIRDHPLDRKTTANKIAELFVE